MERASGQVGLRGAEQRRGAVVIRLGDGQFEPGASPALRKPGLRGSHSPVRLTRQNVHSNGVAKVEKRRTVSDERLRDFLREMLLIRRFEEKVEERFRAGELPGFLHVAIGQEAAEVGVCAAMEDGDVFGSTHRAHGHTLARGTHPNALMAELYGKLEGCSHGYGGSMHLYDVDRGNLGANAVVGGGLPALVGAGLAFKMRDEPRVAVAFFGDGATNTGTFHESMNLAQLWKTKTLFVCENNCVGRVDARLAALAGLGRHVQARPRLRHARDQGRRPGRRGDVYEKAREALAYVRSGAGPVLLDVETYRMHGHFIGDPQVYRSDEDRANAAERDPLVVTRERLDVTDAEWEELEAEVKAIVEASVEFGRNGTTPQPEDALKNVYV